MAHLEQAVRAVEGGLLPAIYIKGSSPQRMTLRERLARYNVPGFSITLISQGEIAWGRGYGALKNGGNDPVTTETLFQAASLSKPVSAMAALHLVEAGMLDLDANVNDALRSWQVPENEHTQKQKVTLRGLLSHTAGLTVSGFPGYAAGEQVPTVQQILDGEPPANSDPVRVMQEPGTAFSYSGGGYTVMQQLLEDVTGTPFADLVHELVLDKLGMASSTFSQPLPKAHVTQAATAHQGNGEAVPGRWHTYPELAAAGLWSTSSDLARFTTEVLRSYAGESNAVLSVEMTRQMLTPPMGRYGLGLGIVEMDGWRRFEHGGWNEGYRSLLGGYIGAGQGVVWMTNGENGNLIGQEVMRALATVFGWPGFEPVEKSVVQVAPAVLAQYEGRYMSADYPDWGAVVTKEGGRLFLEYVPDGARFGLYPESETGFFCCERQEEITFLKDTDDNVEAVMIGEHWRLERVG